MEGDIAHALSFGLFEIVPAGVAAIGCDLARRATIEGGVALQHGQEALAVGGVARFDHKIEDQTALA